MLNKKPGFTCSEINYYAEENYGISVISQELDGERDQNFLLEAEEGIKYVLKVINPDEDESFVSAQAELLAFLNSKTGLVPELIRDKSGNIESAISGEGGQKYIARLVTYLQGCTMGLLNAKNHELILDFGKKAGTLDSILVKYYDDRFKRNFKWDLAIFEDVVSDLRGLIDDDVALGFVDNTLEEYRSILLPRAGKLRKSLVHNDLNDHNIIISSKSGPDKGKPRIAGFIDFGDMLYSYTVADAAVAMAYLMLEEDDPLQAAVTFLEGYTQSFSLKEDELAVLFTMAKMRLVISICMAAGQKKERPGDEYLLISQEAIRNSIAALENIHPLFAESAFRSVCGMCPVKGLADLEQAVKTAGSESFPLMGEKLGTENCLVLDLGTESMIIEGDPALNSPENLGDKINDLLLSSGRQYGIGQYLEPRILYSSPVFQKEAFTENQDRSVHLGIDIFAPAGAPVYAPLDSEVHIFGYNPGKLDYGNMIILKHVLEESGVFYTLYGHLSGSSIKDLHHGARIKKGEAFAAIGKPGENGGWSPHLHFQVINHFAGFDKDYPGVCKPWQSHLWELFSPDPNLILNILPVCFGRRLTIDETLKQRERYFSNALSISYKRPVKISRGWQQFLFDSEGQKYLDAYNNVPHIGHSNPEVRDAVFAQMGILNTNTRYLNDRMAEYAELLLGTFDTRLDKCFFMNSASEANELALRLAFNYTGRKDVIVLDDAYHGNTNTLIDISPYKHNGRGGSGAPPWVHTAPVPDCYRGKYKYADGEAGKKYAAYVNDIINALDTAGNAPAAFIAETCPSVGGQIIPPGGYLEEVYRHVRNAGGLCIADEVQTAFGRMGSSFYAYEEQEVVPDIVVLGKPIGNGHPLAAVVTTAEIADAFDTGMEFFSTFGGNTVSVVAGHKVLEIVLDNKYMQHASETGNILIRELGLLKEKYGLIGDVRGSGLFIGIELVRDSNTLEPATEEAAFVKERLRDMKVLIGTDGVYDNVLKIRPPIPFSKTDALVLADRLDSILHDISLTL
ncbi:MAG: aminotransferase class III-fold pyridoxal phosphate-dependent enzyme [Bacteroidales bacterium]|nr:aminotransferase class III-fold pyridoxal phosphate-dependent enzyme [Bacteroidales bacterium]